MKIVAILGSPRPTGNTGSLVDQALQEVAARGLEIEKIVLSQYKVNPCLGHDNCKSFSVCQQADDAPAILEKFRTADGIILGSPVYYYDMSAQLKAFIDRNYFLYKHGLNINAVCAGLIVVAAGGGIDHTVSAIRRFVKFTTNIPADRMLTVTGYAGKAGDVLNDKNLVEEAGKLGGQMADIIISARGSGAK